MIRHGDALTVLRTLEPNQFHCCVTSPPYYALRDYQTEGQLGLEKTPEEYVLKMVALFQEVRRVLRTDGTLWLNMGDSYLSSGGSGWQGKNSPRENRRHPQRSLQSRAARETRGSWFGLKPKDLVGMPWRLAFALQQDGWFLRSDIIWSKPNAMPESVCDRPTKSHEYIFLLSKSERYHYDADSIKEPCSKNTHSRYSRARDGQTPFVPGAKARAFKNRSELTPRQNEDFAKATAGQVTVRNKRSVWSVSSEGFKGSHFATFPPKLIVPCVLAGCPTGGTVLDPFFGAGTTGVVARRLGRNFLGIEINKSYVEMAEERIRADAPLFNYDQN